MGGLVGGFIRFVGEWGGKSSVRGSLVVWWAGERVGR